MSLLSQLRPRLVSRARFLSTSAPALKELDAETLLALAKIQPGPAHRSRLKEYYERTLSTDLMYQLYNHQNHVNAPERENPTLRLPMWAPDNAYAANRPNNPRPKGRRNLVPNPSYTSSTSIPELEKIVLHTHTPAASHNKNALFPPLLLLQILTAEPLQTRNPGPYGPGTERGLEVTRSTRRSSSFKIRGGMPAGVKVTLKGESMYDFLQLLTDNVWPRDKTFAGLKLPPRSTARHSPSMTSGVVAFGLTPETVALFPQLENVLEKLSGPPPGLHVTCCTSARGRGAQDSARALLAGLGVPFVK